MRADFKVFLDACVLANFGVAYLLLRLTERPRQFLPAWSEEILAEVFRTQTHRLGWPEELATSFGRELRTHFPEAMVAGYGHLAEGLDVNPKDRHVLAAAIHARAEVVLTFNLRDFPRAVLKPWGIKALHPQDYLLTMYEMDDLQVVSRIGTIAAERKRDQEDVLIQLGKSVPLFASRVLDDLGLG